MDENFLERAEANVQAEIERGIARSRTAAPKPADFDGTCSCGDEIPQERVALGYYRCIRCQNLLERKGGSKR